MDDDVPEKIDYAKYHQPQLIDSLDQLLDIRANAKRFVVCVFLVGVLIFAAIYFLHGQVQAWVWYLLAAWGAAAGLWLGVFAALLDFVNRSFANMTRVVDLLLDLTQQVARDVAAVRTGEAKMPTSQQLIKGTYSEVVLPAVEHVVARQLGFLKRPVLFVYRVTLGRLVRWSIKRLPEKKSDESTLENTVTFAQGIADDESAIVSALAYVQGKLQAIGWAARLVVLAPWVAAILLSAILILTIRYGILVAGG